MLLDLLVVINAGSERSLRSRQDSLSAETKAIDVKRVSGLAKQTKLSLIDVS